MLKNIFLTIKSQGISSVVSSIHRRMFPKKAICFELCEKLISNKIGLEVGGPSSVFKDKGILPVYSIVKGLDNCNFAEVTAWEGSVKKGLNFNPNINTVPGQQYIIEATDLSEINSGKYDFILSSHMLEHTANPLKALVEWARVLKNDGIFVILLPHRDGTFDRHRPVTTLDHIIEDFECGIKEDDLTHLPEILRLHDLSRDLDAGDLQSFKERSEKNFENRCLHQHVFDTNLAIQVLDYQHFQIRAVETILPFHIVLIAQKVSDEIILNNNEFLENTADYKYSSPFPTDRLSSTSN
jgi:SAM-dependent methyltransferase